MSYYVYEAHYCGVLAYIGMGHGDRTEHVCSGSSHNKFLNEVHYRSQTLGEPKAEVRIRKRFKTKLEAAKAEKGLIGRLNPLFNSQHARPCKAKLFSTDERRLLEDVGEDFLAAIDVFEGMCLYARVNPKFALTPIGATMWGLPYQWIGACLNLAGLSLMGRCEQIEPYFDWIFVGEGVVKVWLKPFVIQSVIDRLNSGHYVFEVKQKSTGVAFMHCADFKPNEFGSAVPSGYWEHKKQGLVLCRAIGYRSKVKIVIALYDTDMGYKVVCENSQQLMYASHVLGDALNVYRRSHLSGKEFVLIDGQNNAPICQIDLSVVVDFNPKTDVADGDVNVQNRPVELESDIDVSRVHEQEIQSENLNAVEDKWEGFEEDTSVAPEPNTFPAEFNFGIGSQEMPKLDWGGFS